MAMGHQYWGDVLLTSDIVLALDGIPVWPWQTLVIPTTRIRRGCMSAMLAVQIDSGDREQPMEVFMQKLETEKPTAYCRLTIYNLLLFNIFRLVRNFLLLYGDILKWIHLIKFWTLNMFLVLNLSEKSELLQIWHPKNLIYVFCIYTNF